MKAGAFLYLFASLIILFSCRDEGEDFNVQEHFDLLTSHNWVSEHFILNDQEYENIELIANVIDTIENLSPVLIPGDALKAVIWAELEFNTNSIFVGNRHSFSYLKCRDCSEYAPFYHGSELTSRKFSITNGFIESQERILGEWTQSDSYKIDYLGSGRIRLYHWLKIPLSEFGTGLDVIRINGDAALKDDYYFDVIFRQDL